MTRTTHLPTTKAEAQQRGWDVLDVILVTGDAPVDHPSFPAAILGRVLEAAGFRVGVISRPVAQQPASVAVLGVPRLFFGVTAGALDSLVANYTAQKKPRSDDPYAPGGQAGGRPDRALTAYCNLIRQAFGKSAFIVAGGIEASLRRFAHYDFWSDSVRRPILMDCGADVVVHGMGEGPIVDIARRLERLHEQDPSLLIRRADGLPVDQKAQVETVREVPGVVYRTPLSQPAPDDAVVLPSAEEVAADPVVQARAYRIQEQNRDRTLTQDSGGMRVIVNPAWPPLSQVGLDRIYALPFTRDVHPSVSERVPALEQVRFGVTSHRGCFGGCAFCAIGAHQGKVVSSRSAESVVAEVTRIVAHPDFRGTISDVGGPTANMYGLGCRSEERCTRPTCLSPKPCRHLRADQSAYRELLERVRQVPGVKHVFVTTGVRTDLAVLCEPLVRDLAAYHTSGLLKVAPEHVVPTVLAAMRKPPIDSFRRFLAMYRRFSREAGREQYVLPYFIAAHPGSREEDMRAVRDFMKGNRLVAEQCQIFTPTPGTAATVMYATGLDPATLNPIFVERDMRRRQRQKDIILG